MKLQFLGAARTVLITTSNASVCEPNLELTRRPNKGARCHPHRWAGLHPPSCLCQDRSGSHRWSLLSHMREAVSRFGLPNAQAESEDSTSWKSKQASGISESLVPCVVALFHCFTCREGRMWM
jgi:hypothetical protein